MGTDEAGRRGLDRRDPSIAFRLTEKMRFVEDAEVPDETPVDMDLYRKALDLGFDRDDPVVRRIVLQKMRLMLAHRADSDVPDEAELREHHRRRADRWRQPARIDATSASGSGTASVSTTIPMQQVSQCEMRETLNAAPDGGANA